MDGWGLQAPFSALRRVPGAGLRASPAQPCSVWMARAGMVRLTLAVPICTA